MAPNSHVLTFPPYSAAPLKMEMKIMHLETNSRAT